jgi:ABC-type transporter Mla maintaining outer membrane lipid asymmetry permease subunit MlaE
MLYKTNRSADLSNIELFDNKWFAQAFVGGLVAILMLTVLMPILTPATVASRTTVEHTKK